MTPNDITRLCVIAACLAQAPRASGQDPPVRGATVEAAPANPTASTTPPTRALVSTRHGVIGWGVGLQVLRMGALRSPNGPGYARNYEFDLSWLNKGVVFQVNWHPNGRPWQTVNEADNSIYQMMSLSAFFSASLDTQLATRSTISLGVTLNLFNDIVGLGLGVDLYRGVPIGADLGPADTLATGLLGAAFTRDGEFTVENVFVALNLNLAAIGVQGGQP